jgi:hypothetical protein
MDRHEMTGPADGRATRRMVWRQVRDDSSWEFAQLEPRASGATLTGWIVGVADDRPALVTYQADCAAGLSHCRSLRLNCGVGDETRALTLEHAPDRGWLKNGAPAPELDGCTDPDLDWSPSTNAFPLNRLSAETGAVLHVRAAWIRMPGLTVEIAEQTYERIDERRARYRNARSGREAVITIDDAGLPLDYAEVWQRIADWRAS